MRISGFTFLRNGILFGYPFLESIRSVLPLCDEFVMCVGKSEDGTLEAIESLNEEKIRIIETTWNPSVKEKGYVYAQQKMIAQFSCTGDWLFYIEGDEVVHEDDLDKIRKAMHTHLNDNSVEALVFHYVHFYGNGETFLWSPGWYREAPRIIKSSVRCYAPDGLFWVVLSGNRKGRYPKAVRTGATMYHYGWARKEHEMNLKSQHIQQYWSKEHRPILYRESDPAVLREFKGNHPAVIRPWLPPSKGIFKANPQHRLTARERKHRWMLKLERWFGLELSKKHHRIVK